MKSRVSITEALSDPQLLGAALGDLKTLNLAVRHHHEMQHHHAFDMGLAGGAGILLETVELGEHPAEIRVAGFSVGFLRGRYRSLRSSHGRLRHDGRRRDHPHHE